MDAQADLAGRKLGHYEIVAPLGQGGMGVVYRARDLKLGREVALKVLPEGFAEDGERLARFEREARLLASLNHPNIATLHGFEEEGGRHWIVMELVEGETLADRLASGPMAVDEAASRFGQVARALEAAHESGIIHRDLKPANIKITPDGTVKVLDFGLAKALGAGIREDAPSDSPTVTREGTETGVILGTAAYMSPEQARGRPLDKRTDVWSFGCVLFEAVTGRRAFAGETLSDTLAAILSREPDWSAVPEAPAWVRRLLRRCLEKDHNRRLRDIGDARLEIEVELEDDPAVSRAPSVPATSGSRLPWFIAAAASGLAAVAFLAPWRSSPGNVAPVIRASISLAEGSGYELPDLSEPAFLDISPDGRRLVYALRAPDGVQRLYLRDLESGEMTPLPDTEAAQNPFFSPDGQWIGFDARGEIRKMRVDRPQGGAVTLLDTSTELRGASWGADGHIVVSLNAGPELGLLRIPDSGGTPEVLTRVAEGELSHRWPDLLPGGKGVIYSVVTGINFDESRIVVESLETGERWELLRACNARYVATGHLIYAREDTLYAAPFDVDQMELTGSGVPVQSGVHVRTLGPGSVHATVSRNGTFVYLPRDDRKSRLVLVDHTGRANHLAAPNLPYDIARFSHDGGRLAVSVDRPGYNDEKHVWDFAQQSLSLVASRAEDERGRTYTFGFNVAWSPDGRRLAVSGTTAGERMTMFSIAADGSGDARSLVQNTVPLPAEWREDERLLYIDQQHPRSPGRFDFFELNLDTGESRPLFENTSPHDRSQPTVSPNGRWLAYTEHDTGRDEVYITPYDRPGARTKVSSDGGASPLWASDGRTLYYRIGSAVMAVAISGDAEPLAGMPRHLFEGPYRMAALGIFPRIYDLSPDGEHFVMIEDEAEATVTELELVVNWFGELESLVPTSP